MTLCLIVHTAAGPLSDLPFWWSDQAVALFHVAMVPQRREGQESDRDGIPHQRQNEAAIRTFFTILTVLAVRSGLGLGKRIFRVMRASLLLPRWIAYGGRFEADAAAIARTGLLL
jgi:hypothetical protein